jgi:hypothetical protein
MKKIILIAVVFISMMPMVIQAQKKYYNLDFEKTDSIGKKVFQWKNETFGTEFYVDSTTKAQGKNSMFANLQHVVDVKNGVPFYFVLQKANYAGLRAISISVKIMFRNEKPNAGLWCTVKKDNELLGSKCTYKGNVSMNVIPFSATAGTSVPVIPYTWIPYNFTIKFDNDPTNVIIGLILLNDRAWFDNIEIKLNGKPLENMVFGVTPSN